MKRRIRSAAVIMAVLLAFSVMPAGASTSQEAGDGAPLRLRAATFRPARGEAPDLPDRLRRTTPAEIDVWIVQFDGPVPTTARGELEAAGLEVLSYLPDFAYKVRGAARDIEAARQRPDVVATHIFEPGFKLDDAPSPTGLYTVRIERGAGPAAVRAAIRRAGIDVVSAQGSVAIVTATADQLADLAAVTDVAWVSPFRFKERHNEYGAGVIMGATSAHTLGYDGSTQIVAVADTGIGDGTAAGAHPDIPAGRVTAVYDWPTSTLRGCYRAFPDGAQDVDSGHGTHVAGSVLSDGDAAGVGTGTAPGASLVFQAVEDYIDTFAQCAGSPDGYYLTGLPADLTDLFQQAYDAGARIHSNSWGSSVAGDYTEDSATVDQFMWDNPDMLITTSAGNAGIDGDANGVVDDDSIGSPATAKNLLTVGASEGARDDAFPCDLALTYVNPNTGQSCASQGGFNDVFTYGAAWPDDFPAAPISADASAGDAEQMAAFSSRGPTDDGRIKPDVVAPGTWILSGYSDLYQEGYDGVTNPQNGAFQYDGWGFPLTDAYKYMGGTSMSNPLVAGAAAVVRDYYEKADGHAASAALTKATLINSAVDLLDENNDGADDNDFPIPNVHEGWGRVNVAAAVDGSHEYVDGDTVSTGGTATSTYTVDGGSPLKVTLVWTDYPSDEAAAVNLVNDLDLVVTAPDGTTYQGNVFAGGWAQTGGSADRVNNVENVYVASAGAGTWTVDVFGFNVPFGPQPFALIVDGGVGGATTDTPPSVTVTAPVDGSTVSGSVTVTAVATDDIGVTQVEFVAAGTVIGTDTDGSDGWSAVWDTTATADGSATVTATATDTIGQTGTDSVSVTVDNGTGSGVELHIGDLDATTGTQGSRWFAIVTATVHDDLEGPISGATVNFSVVQGNRTQTGSCTTDGSGTCDWQTRAAPERQVPEMTITVTDVTHASLTYAAAANHDPDGDSDGTSIGVTP